MRTITIDEVESWNPCDGYERERLEALFGGRDSLDAFDVACLDIPPEDRVWALIRMMDEQEKRLFACDCAQRVLHCERREGREPDPASWDVIKISRKFAEGKVSRTELNDAASEAAYAAYAAFDAAFEVASAAYAAASAAAYAASDAAYAASSTASAARRSEMEEQVNIACKYLMGLK